MKKHNIEEVKKDYSEYLELIIKAEEGDSKSELKLARCYLKGDVFQKNEYLGIHYLKKSAKSGNSKAQNDLGELFYDGNCVEKNLETLKRTVEINDEMYKLTLADFQAGNSPIMAVFGMKTAHIMSEVAYQNSQIDWQIARYQLHKLLGLVNPIIK